MGMPVIQPSTITREESVADIIDSIATEERAIAHILNAEGEKLQAIINKSDITVKELLVANHSVKTAVDTVIELESALKNKISLFSNMICQTT